MGFLTLCKRKRIVCSIECNRVGSQAEIVWEGKRSPWGGSSVFSNVQQLKINSNVYYYIKIHGLVDKPRRQETIAYVSNGTADFQ
jgi:hypothetical protein